jgi:molecular chaperone GrpE
LNGNNEHSTSEGSEASEVSEFQDDAAELAKRDADFSRLDDKVAQEELRGRLAEAEQSAAEHKDRYLRALADLENTKKRAIKDRADLLKYQGERIFAELLQVVDNMELALQHADANPESLKDGVQLIHKMLLDMLSKWEVRAESALGKEFDPNRHSALSKMPTAEHPSGTVLSEFRKAYFYKDKLLRPAEVVVATAPEGEAPDAAER